MISFFSFFTILIFNNLKYLPNTLNLQNIMMATFNTEEDLQRCIFDAVPKHSKTTDDVEAARTKKTKKKVSRTKTIATENDVRRRGLKEWISISPNRSPNRGPVSSRNQSPKRSPKKGSSSKDLMDPAKIIQTLEMLAAVDDVAAGEYLDDLKSSTGDHSRKTRQSKSPKRSKSPPKTIMTVAA